MCKVVALLAPSSSNRTPSTDRWDNYNPGLRVYYQPCWLLEQCPLWCKRCTFTLSPVSAYRCCSNYRSESEFDHITTSVIDELHCLPINQKIKYKLSARVFKCLRRTAPPYLTEQYVFFSADASRRLLRLSIRNCLMCTRVNLSRYGARGLCTSVSKTRN